MFECVCYSNLHDFISCSMSRSCQNVEYWSVRGRPVYMLEHENDKVPVRFLVENAKLQKVRVIA